MSLLINNYPMRQKKKNNDNKSIEINFVIKNINENLRQ